MGMEKINTNHIDVNSHPLALVGLIKKENLLQLKAEEDHVVLLQYSHKISDRLENDFITVISQATDLANKTRSLDTEKFKPVIKISSQTHEGNKDFDIIVMPVAIPLSLFKKGLAHRKVFEDRGQEICIQKTIMKLSLFDQQRIEFVNEQKSLGVKLFDTKDIVYYRSNIDRAHNIHLLTDKFYDKSTNRLVPKELIRDAKGKPIFREAEVLEGHIIDNNGLYYYISSKEYSNGHKEIFAER